MPIIKSAIKKVRKDKRRTLANKKLSEQLKTSIKKLKKGAIELPKVFSIIDRAAKKGIIHKNKAARLKSSVSKMTVEKVAVIKKTKKSSKKTAVK